jgi:hypothetical protein
MPVAGCGGAEEGENLDQESALAFGTKVRLGLVIIVYRPADDFG